MNRSQRKYIASGAAALAVLAVVAPQAATGSVEEQHASATALKVNTALTDPIESTTVQATGTQGPVTASEIQLQVASFLTANGLNASAETKNKKMPGCVGPVECDGAFAKAEAEVANVSLGVPVLPDLPALDLLEELGLDLEGLVSLTASAIKSECRLDAHNLLARTTILDADLGVALLAAILGGDAVDLDAMAGALVTLPPNTKLNVLDGLLEITINEQIIDFVPTDMRAGLPTADRAAVTVNALHVRSDLLDIDVVVSQSNCEIIGSGPKAIDLANSFDTGGSTIEIGAVSTGGINLPPLPIKEIIELVDEIVPLPVQELVDFVDQIVPLGVNDLIDSISQVDLLGLGGMLNIKQSGLGVVLAGLY